MAHWWVNHKQTVRQETDGGYVWSPKANANGAHNVSYDNLTRCQRGDVVFSYAYGRIGSIGLVEAAAITAPKPPEFGAAGDNWSQEGWLVRVNWQPLRQPLVPQTFFELLQPLLPERHSPISTNTGRGNQGVYLAELSDALGLLLLKLIEDHADPAVRVHLVVLAEEGEAASSLLADMQQLQAVPSTTERDALTKARLGQGLFRHRVAELEPACRVTGLMRQEFLVASHIKPWRDCDNRERLSGANGLLLSPHIDKLFDRHWISFDSDGQLIWQHEAAGEALRCWGIEGANLIQPFSREQEHFLGVHRRCLRT
ncbi:HNH endonuclease [Cyanobium sp. ATX 6E8]|uniref:HNH endonuclease n=1 Tax=Cyanobium sp. ATX 6E8 TaxID=2823701 RepID=UPI0020CC44AD|nr:HNH endonuclease signature motif containing protein [Cyanobium sp. ATX 6E8]MCP9943012.1 HNH endonuclease [Cyanobium sp. ATX 6E8]